MNDELRGKAEGRGDSRLASRAANGGTHLGYRATRLQQLGACRGVDGPIDSAAAEHPLICRVDDGVYGKSGDISLDYGRKLHGVSWNAV